MRYRIFKIYRGKTYKTDIILETDKKQKIWYIE